MFRKILLPIDVAEPEIAKEAIDVAVGVAKAFNSDLRLIHVASPIIVASPMAVIPQSVYDELGVYEKSELERMAAAVDRPKGTVTTVVRIGGVYPELLAEATEWQADLIIVGAHKRSMATYLLGSSAAAIVRHATCTVMVVRSGRKASLL
ncbi:MAG: universal stress protein [Roseiarcus sp.]|jgi:nucleotide-binding universal stress UspA family protein